jgi:hypothetical protein
MKTIVLLLTGVLFSMNTVTAADIKSDKKGSDLDKTQHYRYAQPISFMERGVEFLIFPDGSFDFNTNAINTNYNDTYYRNNSKRSNINVSYRGPNATIEYSSKAINRGVYIEKDRNGQVRRIGDVFLNYDRYGNITRAGSVYINYNRGNGVLKQVGGLSVNYNRWGEIVSTRGYVNYNNRINNYEIVNNRNDRDNRYDNDDEYYYFKQNGEVKKQKRRK